MDALTEFSEYLQSRIDTGENVPLDPGLHQSFSLRLTLLLDGYKTTGTIGPNVQKISVEEGPEVFERINYSATGESIFYLSEDGPTHIRVSDGKRLPPPDGAEVASRVNRKSDDGVYYADRSDYVGVFENATGRQVAQLSWQRDSYEACTVNVAFSHDNQHVAVSYAYDNAVRVWTLESGEYLGEFKAPDHEAALSFSPDGKFLLAGTKRGSVLFSLETKLWVYRNTTSQIFSVGYHPFGKSCAIGSVENHIEIIDLEALQRHETKPFDVIVEQIIEHKDLWFSQSDLDMESLYYRAFQL
ncbi:WD40 repeat domain-containing protein [Hyphococcus lacteus]|uniref:WD40 repeat domain-containing protein n=1 Tax=Hyphococcus lacteus TaxID=3143536 RepID=A0ABV3Z7S8_9PROT